MASDRQATIRPATFHYLAGDSEPEHSHPEHQLVYADHGVLNVETNSSRWVVPPLRALWVPADIPHRIVAKADSEMATLYLSRSTTVRRPGVAVIYVSPLLRELIRYIHRDDSSGPPRRRLEAVILDQLEAAASAPPLRLPRLEDPRARAVAEALDRDPTDERTLREFGRDIGAHERTLQRIFKAETGTTFGQWRTQLRLQHGIVALTQGHSVTDAATRCGYHEPSAFIAAFRAAFGTTPGRYLRDHSG
ncbi:MAG: helix-turn-helix transcriptional regulator [Acidimicrobiales bacterium]